jgi:hypothetical protein
LSKSAVARHRDHIADRLKQATQAEDITAANSVAATLKLLQAKTQALMLAAEAKGDIRVALLGIREFARLIEIAIKATPEGGTGGTDAESPRLVIVHNLWGEEIEDDEFRAFREWKRRREAQAPATKPNGETDAPRPTPLEKIDWDKANKA